MTFAALVENLREFLLVQTHLLCELEVFAKLEEVSKRQCLTLLSHIVKLCSGIIEEQVLARVHREYVPQSLFSPCLVSIFSLILIVVIR